MWTWVRVRRWSRSDSVELALERLTVARGSERRYPVLSSRLARGQFQCLVAFAISPNDV